jgi:hypothetical protein
MRCALERVVILWPALPMKWPSPGAPLILRMSLRVLRGTPRGSHQ